VKRKGKGAKFEKLFEHKLVCHLRNKYLLNKVDQTKIAVLESLYFKWCTLNANKMDVATFFSKVICGASSCYFVS